MPNTQTTATINSDEGLSVLDSHFGDRWNAVPPETSLEIPAMSAVSRLSGHETSEQIQLAELTPVPVQSTNTDAVNDSIVLETLPAETPKKEKRTLARLNHALGPIGAGMIIDVVDLTTYGPIGLVLGVPIGAFAGYWLARSMRLEPTTCWILAAVAGIYCTIPGTEFLPLGTLVGALVRFEDDDPS